MLRLGRCLHNLNNTVLLKFVKYVLETEHSHTIVNGIRRQLQIEDTSQEYLNELLHLCTELNTELTH